MWMEAARLRKRKVYMDMGQLRKRLDAYVKRAVADNIVLLYHHVMILIIIVILSSLFYSILVAN